MRSKVKTFIGVVLFFAIGIVLFIGAGAVAQPYWTDNQTTDKIRSFYAEPENSVETLFLGTSVVTDGVVPMELYDAYGMSAYDLGTSAQPVLASYYWAREAERLHPETLRNVVLEVSSLKLEPEMERAQMATDDMRLPTKLEAVRAYTDGVGEALNHLFPLLAYHDRWAELDGDDLAKFLYPEHRYLRGNEPNTTTYLEHSGEDGLTVPSYALDGAAAPTELDATQLAYLDRLVAFCREWGLNLILAKMPRVDWTSGDHNAVQALADRYGLAFLDYNYDPYLSEMGFDVALDSYEGTHMNGSGARKFSLAIGRYLSEAGLVTDVRGKAGYGHLDEQLADHRAITEGVAALRQGDDFAEYLAAALDGGGRTVTVAVSEEGAAALTPAQREELSRLGLEGLAALEPGTNYLATIEDGRVVEEATLPADTSTVFDDFTYWKAMTPAEAHLWLYDDADPEAQAIRADIEAVEQGEAIDGFTTRPLEAGAEVIVYDDGLEAVVDSAFFGASDGLTRIADPEAALEAALAAGTAPEELPPLLRKLYDFRQADADARAAAGVGLN